ncbi:TOBE domain-containing protein [Halorhabdus sp. BNX81]|uniref:TOBE domain-containing protein n=1 Tax=Halorhabdus sp. BNX81 TaxID=2980181 RepID=UPI0023DD3F25|nr:TOBE domain-containing protein [Halorhabdus sp. BNX81]WEL20641.1 N-terminal domain of molybdenum-binding protein [Halorhabdus sp. BNX81]
MGRPFEGWDMDAGFEAHLRIDGVAFDRADAALLRAIDEQGSLNAAADALGRSYSRSHARLTDLESAVGRLVERRRGGSGGGGSRLTEDARELLARFERLEAVLDDSARTEEVAIDGRVLDREGELATVETDAGTVRALLAEDCEAVQVLFRADAITLHRPDTAPPAADTSARNRFHGTVAAIDYGEAIAHVTVEVASDIRLRVTVTRTSVANLELSPGVAVVAAFKAAATRAVPR